MWEPELASVSPCSMDTLRWKWPVLLWVPPKKCNHYNYPALKKHLGILVLQEISVRLCELSTPSRKFHPMRGWSDSVWCLSTIQRVSSIKELALNELCSEKSQFVLRQRSRHTERHSCKGQRAASAHIRSVFHQWPKTLQPNPHLVFFQS